MSGRHSTEPEPKAIISATVVIALLAALLFFYLIFVYQHSGLTAAVYRGENFQQLLVQERVKNVYFKTYGATSEAGDRNHFSIEYSGFLSPPKEGDYTIKSISDDGVKIWINDELLINDWHIQGTKGNQKTVFLHKGKNKLKIHYFDNVGEAYLDLYWRAQNGGEFKRIPTRHLFYK